MKSVLDMLTPAEVRADWAEACCEEDTITQSSLLLDTSTRKS